MNSSHRSKDANSKGRKRRNQETEATGEVQEEQSMHKSTIRKSIALQANFKALVISQQDGLASCKG